MRTYTFYFDTWYVNCGAEEDFTEEQLWITEKTTEKEKEVILNDTYKDFLAGYDSWWYEKE